MASLHVLRHMVYEQYVEETADEAQSYDTWCSEMAKEIPQFQYWSRVIDLELLLNQYVKSPNWKLPTLCGNTGTNDALDILLLIMGIMPGGCQCI